MQNFEAITESIKIKYLVTIVHQYLGTDILLPESKSLSCCKLHFAAENGYWVIAKDICGEDIFSSGRLLQCKNHSIKKYVSPGMGYMVSNLKAYSSFIHAIDIAVKVRCDDFINHCKGIFQKTGIVVSLACEVKNGNTIPITEEDTKMFDKTNVKIMIIGAAYYGNIKVVEQLEKLFPLFTKTDFNNAVLFGLAIARHWEIAKEFINKRSIIVSLDSLLKYLDDLDNGTDTQFFEITGQSYANILTNLGQLAIKNKRR